MKIIALLNNPAVSTGQEVNSNQVKLVGSRVKTSANEIQVKGT